MFFSKSPSSSSYLNKPIIGMDISGRNIKFVELKQSGNQLRLKNFGNKKIEKKVFEKGKIQPKENLIENLKILREELNNPFVAASLPEEKVFIKIVELPQMPEVQIRQHLKTNIEELVPFSLQDITFDYEIIKNPTSKEKIKIVLNTFPRNIIESFADVFYKAGFTPIIFEPENQSVFRALVKKENEDSIMIIDFGKTKTSFVIGEEGIVKFSSTFKIGGEHMDKALAKQLNLDISEAKEIKKRQNIKRIDDEATKAITPATTAIKDEAIRILRYWNEYAEQQNFNHQDVKKIIICGGGANLTGLTDYFTRELKKTVEIGNPWKNITNFKNYIPEIHKQESLSYTTAIGLALRPFTQEKRHSINLISQETNDLV